MTHKVFFITGVSSGLGQGISSALAKEVKGFGVFVTALEPGSFRTDWAGRSMIRTERSISDYNALFDPIRAARQAKSGKQRGDPSKLGKAVLKLVESPNPPMHLLLGTDALQLVQAELKNLQDEITAWESVTKSTDFDQ